MRIGRWAAIISTSQVGHNGGLRRLRAGANTCGPATSCEPHTRYDTGLAGCRLASITLAPASSAAAVRAPAS